MKYLFADWKNLRDNFNHKTIFLFLDCDGTLSPIKDKPEKAIIPSKTKELLETLSKSPLFKIAIISGRALNDVKKMAGIKNIIYAGNHGLEIVGPQIKFASPLRGGYKNALKRIKNRLNVKLSSIKGVLVEDKNLSLSLHYRLVNKKDLPYVKSAFDEIVQPYFIKGAVKVTHGKKAYEIVPPVEWDKGKAVLWLLDRIKSITKKRDILPIYIGDDVTDENAFKVLGDSGLTIFVGRQRISSAKYYLKNTQETYKLLKTIHDLRFRNFNNSLL